MVPTGSFSRMSTRDSGDCAAMRVASGPDQASHAVPAAVARRKRLRLAVWFGVPLILFGLHLQDGKRIRRKRARKSEEHTSELQSPCNLVCRLLLEKKKKIMT